MVSNIPMKCIQMFIYLLYHWSVIIITEIDKAEITTHIYLNINKETSCNIIHCMDTAYFHKKNHPILIAYDITGLNAHISLE